MKIIFSLIAVGLVLSSPVLAEPINGGVNLLINNPTDTTQSFDLTLNLPTNLNVIDEGDGHWNSISNKLVFTNLSFTPDESVNLFFKISGEPDSYILSGQMIGEVDSEYLEVDILPFTLILLETGEVIIGPPPEVPPPILLFEPEKLERVAKDIFTPIAVIIGLAAGLASGLAAVNASAPLAAALQSLWTQLLAFFSIFSYNIKKRVPWGRVINSITKKPIPAASVSLIENEFKKIKETQLTDQEGRFGFVTAPGSYYLIVKKRGFQEKTTAVVTVDDSGSSLNIDILLEPIQAYTTKVKLRQIINYILEILEVLNPVFLIVGTLLSTLIYWLLPNNFNLAVLVLYLLLDIIKIILILVIIKSFGQVFDWESNQPISLALIRVFDAKTSWLLATKVSDTKGRYNLLTMPGSYYLTVSHINYEPYQSEIKEINRSSVETTSIKLNRKKVETEASY